MAYVTVQEETQDRLRLSRQPSNNSWAMLIGFVAFGLGAAYYGNDHIIWKVIYVTCGMFVGISCMDDWEDCDFDKTTGEIRLRKHSAWDIILSPITSKDSVIVCRIAEVTNVRLEEEKVNYFGTSYQVVLIFSTGMSIGITETFTFSSTDEHKKVAKLIRKFLGLPEGEEEPVTFLDDKFEDNDSSMDEEDEVDPDEDIDTDDFEQIDKSELMEDVTQNIPTEPSQSDAKEQQ